MLSVRNLTKSYAARVPGGAPVHAVNDVSFDVAQGAFFTLLGPSGCGKSTTLQCIAGLEQPTSGRIEMDGTAVYCSDRRLLVPANRRNIGMVFQSYAIWPHMTVFDNVAFPLVHGGRPVPAAQVRDRVMAALDLVKLTAFADRPSPHLSGGQQQRVALARALVHEPALLLLDEPLSNLDAKLRDQMRVEIRQLVLDLGITTVFVTHDQLEAMSMSDEIVLMRDGGIVQRGAPRDVYLYPRAAFAADFMGRSNLIPARAAEGGLRTAFGHVPVALPEGMAPGAEAVLVVRPHALLVHPAAPGDPAPLADPSPVPSAGATPARPAPAPDAAAGPARPAPAPHAAAGLARQAPAPHAAAGPAPAGEATALAERADASGPGPARDPAPDTALFPATVEALSFLGDVTEADLRLGPVLVRAAVDPYLALRVGARVTVEFRAARCVATPPDPAPGAPAAPEAGA